MPVTKLLLSFLVAFFASEAVAVEGARIEYVNIFGGQGAVFSIEEDELRMLDLRYDLHRCPLGSDFICISSGVFSFSVPKSFPALSRWVQFDATYELRERRVSEILGRKITYWVIRQTWKKSAVDFAYSPVYGVLSMRSKKGQLILQGKCGIAPQVDSAECQ